MSEDRSQAVPKLAAGCDITSLSLSPQEGFLLSRVDGSTPWHLLREMAGFSPVEVDSCIERWLKEGVLVVSEAAAPKAAAKPAPAPSSSEVKVDPSLDLSEAQQREILNFEKKLAGSYHDILGVDRDADTGEIKRAYFKLSKEYHPDQYFRRNVGDYGERIERIFRKVVEAYELLSDPTTRKEVERGIGAGGRGRGALPFLGAVPRIVEERKQKARSFFETGMRALGQGKHKEAAGSLRLAISFDPYNETYKECFADAQRGDSDTRASKLKQEADGRFNNGDQDIALKIYEEFLELRPYDSLANQRAALLTWQLHGELRRARDYATRACEVDDESALNQSALGRICAASQLWTTARRALEKALHLDPLDDEARQALEEVERGERAAGGGN